MNKKGFTVIEMLFSLLVFSISMGLVVQVIPNLKKITSMQIHIEEEIAFRQVRRVISLAESILVQPDNLNFFYLGENATLEIENHQLVKKNGYVLYFEGFDFAQFKQKDKCIYFEYEKDGEKNERFLGCKT